MTRLTALGALMVIMSFGQVRGKEAIVLISLD